MPAPDSLQSLARLYNLQTAYFDGLGELRKAPPEAILRVLKSLGAELESLGDVTAALRVRRQALWRRVIEPITVAWQDRPFQIKLRLPVRWAEAPVAGEIRLENGAAIDCVWEEIKTALPIIRDVEGARYTIRSLVLAAPPPLGYHELHLRVGEPRSPIANSFRALARLRSARVGETLGRFLPALRASFRTQLGRRGFFRLGGVCAPDRRAGRSGGGHSADARRFFRRAIQSESLRAGEPAFLE